MPDVRDHSDHDQAHQTGVCKAVTDLPFTQNFAAGLVAEEIVRWAVPFSLAATKGIAFAFSSSAY